MSDNINIRQYLTIICVCSFVTVGLLAIIGTKSDPLLALLSESIIFAIITILMAYLIFHSKQLVGFYLLAYIVKLLIGVIHYLVFIDADYFASGHSMKLHHEFQAVLQTVEMIVDGKQITGVFSFIFPQYIPHEELWNIIAVPFYYTGTYLLNIVPINAFASLFAAMNVLLVDKCVRGKSYNQPKILRYLVAYFPVTLITSYYFRDMVGLSLMSVGLVLLSLSKNMFQKVLMLVVTCYLFYLQRNAYVLVPILMFLFDYLLLGNKKNILIKIIAVFICIMAVPFAYSLFETESTLKYVSGSTKWPIYMLPFKLIVGLIGPFPWSNFLKWHTFPEVSYYLGDYCMAVINIGLLITVVKAIPIKNFKHTIDMSFITGIVLFIFGLMNTYMHMTYISIGIYFLIPWFFRNFRDLDIKKNIKISLLFLVVLNLFIMLTGVSGLASSVK